MEDEEILNAVNFFDNSKYFKKISNRKYPEYIMHHYIFDEHKSLFIIISIKEEETEIKNEITVYDGPCKLLPEIFIEMMPDDVAMFLYFNLNLCR